MRFYGSVVLRFCGSTVLRFYSSVVLQFCGCTVLWLSEVLRFYSSVVLQFCGSTVLWLYGSVVKRGSTVLRFYGSMETLDTVMMHGSAVYQTNSLKKHLKAHKSGNSFFIFKAFPYGFRFFKK
jgi:hypothetical protein